eukprot:165707_1
MIITCHSILLTVLYLFTYVSIILTQSPTYLTYPPNTVPAVSITYPTLQPTIINSTSNVEHCDDKTYPPTWCSTINIYPSGENITTTTVNVILYDDNEGTEMNLSFVPQQRACTEPRITFEYEQIDISQSWEDITIFDNSRKVIKQCNGNGGYDAQCGVFWTCLSEYHLNTN